MAKTTKTAVKKTTAKKAAPKVKPKKTAVAKKTIAEKKTDNKSVIKKGSKLACKVCGFAITVDRVCGCVEESHLICCDTPMKLKRPVAKTK